MAEDKFNEYCENLLAQYKRRNSKAVTRHVKGVCDILRNEGDHVVQPKFGGSVQKGTYVTGLSDADVLLIVNQSTLKNKPPSDVIEYVRGTIQSRLTKNAVTSGKLAVTIRYADNTEVQVLPAIRTTDGFRIAEPGSTNWSNVVHPERFVERLIKVNTARGGRVVPVIKLAKSMAACFIKDPNIKISGYHMESLAIDAFKGYQGPLDPRATLIHFLEHSMEAVKHPIPDPTGQSKHVDGDLGPAGSEPRKRVSEYLGQMCRKVKSCQSRAEFNSLFCIGG